MFSMVHFSFDSAGEFKTSFSLILRSVYVILIILHH